MGAPVRAHFPLPSWPCRGAQGRDRGARAAMSVQPLRGSGPRRSEQARPRVWGYKAQEGASLRNAETHCWGRKGLGLAPKPPSSPGQGWYLSEADPGGRCPCTHRSSGTPSPGWVSGQRRALNSCPLLCPLGSFGSRAQQCPHTHPGRGQLSWAVGDPRGRRPCNPRNREACHRPCTCKVGARVWPTEPVSCLLLSVLRCLLNSRIVIK